MTKKLKRNIIRIAIGAGVFAVGLLLEKFVNEWAGLGVLIAAYLIVGYDVLKGAASNIAHGHVFDENFLMMVATFGAFACREYVEAVAVMLFYQTGECFQSYAVNKSRKSIRALMDIRPDFARVERDGLEAEVDPSEVSVGERIIIRPGERIPLDGVIISGNSTIDTAAITGESLPAEVTAGDKVVSGCVNLSGVITVEVSSEFAQSTVARVLSLVEDASSRKAKSEQFITVFARVYTPIVVCSAVALALIGTLITHDFRTWIYRAMTFLLISCPCALVISVPLSFFGGIGGAGKKGILIKGGNYMDTLSKIDTLVLDKTGTVTKGNFALGKISVSDYLKNLKGDEAEKYLVNMAALCEAGSNHPIARSIAAAGNNDGSAAAFDIKEIAGRGVSAVIAGENWYVGNFKLMEDVLPTEEKEAIGPDECGEYGTVVYVAKNDRYMGHIHIVDEIKDGAADAIKLMHASGIKETVMLTGDNEESARIVSERVGITKFRAGLTPIDKVTAIEEIIAANPSGKVAFVGDGINDAPVLSRADIGIAMGAMGSDAAIEAADVVIMTDELSKIATARKIAAKTLRIVRENIVFALGVKLLVLVLAAFGIATMWAAVFADVGVAFIAIMNSLRALKN